ncbi:MAG TPA: hypothetical protein HA261_04095, partial [Methanosarcina sp.]|nr:hypothetical protein [Methanosarcina sp.]
MDLAVIAQQATDVLVPYLPFIYAGGIAAADKGKDMLIEGGKKVTEKVADKALDKVSDGVINKAEKILSKLNLKKNQKLEESAKQVARDPKDPKAVADLQQIIREILNENPELAKEIEFTINLNVESIDQLAVGNYNNFFNFEKPSGDEFIKIIEYLDQKRKEAVNQEILSHYNPSTLPKYPNRLKEFVTKNRSEELIKALTYLENHQILLISGVGGVGKSTLAKALVDLRPVNAPEPFWFSFYDNQDAKLDDILEKLAAYINAPEIVSFKAERREPGKTDIDKFTGELHRRSEIWLIFD